MLSVPKWQSVFYCCKIPYYRHHKDLAGRGGAGRGGDRIYLKGGELFVPVRPG